MLTIYISDPIKRTNWRGWKAEVEDVLRDIEGNGEPGHGCLNSARIKAGWRFFKQNLCSCWRKFILETN